MSGRVLRVRRPRAKIRCAWLLTLFLVGCADAVAPPAPPAAVTSIEVVAPRPLLTVGDTLIARSTLRAADGSPLIGRVVEWSSSEPDVASVNQSGLVVALANGTTAIRARSEGQEGQVLITVTTRPLEIISVAPSPLIAGETAELRGRAFNPRAGAMSITLGGALTTLGAVTDSSIVFTVPCVASGDYALTVRSPGTDARQQQTTVRRRELSLAVGEFTVLPTARQAGCTLLPATVGPSGYLLTVFSTATTPATTASFEWVGMRGTLVSSFRRAMPATNVQTRAQEIEPDSRDAVHDAHLQRERQRLATGSPVRNGAIAPRLVKPAPLLKNALKRFYFTFGSSCNDTSRVLTARAMIVGRRVALWEDTTNAVRASMSPELATWYARLLRIADDEQLPLVQRLIGDPLGRDALTDADGLVHLLFSQRVNATGSGAFVTSCDLRPRQSALGGNSAEIIYGITPTTTVSNPESTESPDGWFSFMSRTVVHELKHVASYASRLTRQAPFEEVWMEEGTARMAEEAWAREYLYRQAPRSNAGFGSSADGGVYCDFHPANAGCTAVDPLRRPSYGMRRHFNDLRNKLVQPSNWSPFGDAPGQSGAVYYNSAWSLLRHAADHSEQSDSAFLTALNNTDRLGLSNLSQVSGRSVESLLGAWGMALLADDRSELQRTAPLTQFLSWNFRSVYAGLYNAPAWQSRWNTPYPVEATPLTVDTLGASLVSGPAIRGGGHTFFEVAPSPGSPLVLQLRGPSNTPIPQVLRLAIVRIH